MESRLVEIQLVLPFDPCGMSIIHDQIAPGGAWGWKIQATGNWHVVLFLPLVLTHILFKMLEVPSNSWKGWATLQRMMFTQWTESETLILKAIGVFYLTVLFMFHLCCKMGSINISADWKLPAAENRGQIETNVFFMWFRFMDTLGRWSQCGVASTSIQFSFISFTQTQSRTLTL